MKFRTVVFGSLGLSVLLAACGQHQKTSITSVPTGQIAQHAELPTAYELAHAPSPDRRFAPIINADSPDAIAGQYIVVLGTDHLGDLQALSAHGLIQSLGLEASGVEVKSMYSQALNGFSARLSAQNLKILRANKNVKYIEQDQYVYPQSSIQAQAIQTTNAATWGLDRIDQRSQTLDNRYTYGSTGKGVSVYVIDTGIDTQHSDFGGRAVWGADLSGENRQEDCLGHGTHVAGIVGGQTYGVAKEARLVALKIFRCEGNNASSLSAIASAVDWAIADGSASKKVINLSLGPRTRSIMPVLDEAVKKAVAAGITVVNAAANTTSGDDACFYSPSHVPEGISVGNVDRNNKKASDSNYGRCVEMFAPGDAITSTWLQGKTNTLNGTSMATAFVSGAAARILSSSAGTLSPAQVKQRLQSSANTNILDASSLGAGSVNRLLYIDPSDQNAGTNTGGSNTTIITTPGVTIPTPPAPPTPPTGGGAPIGTAPIPAPPTPTPPAPPTGGGTAPIGTAPIPAPPTGGGTTPIGTTPIGTTPIGTTPIGTTPIGTTPTPPKPAPNIGPVKDIVIRQNGNGVNGAIETVNFTYSYTRVISGTSIFMTRSEDNGSVFRVTGGKFTITTSGGSGTDYDAYLQKYENGVWKDVAYGVSSTSNERLTYNNLGQTGIYRVELYGYKGNGPVQATWHMVYQ